MLHHADALISKFGYGTVDIDDFDIFLIDNGIVTDPGTSDTASLEYKGFVQDRGKARKGLDSSGRTLKTKPFRLMVVVAGETYAILPLMEGNAQESSQMQDRWRTYGASRERAAVANKRSNYIVLQDKKKAHDRGDISAEELSNAVMDYQVTESAETKVKRINGFIAMLMAELETTMTLSDQRAGKGDE